jgi:hypothetical protein
MSMAKKRMCAQFIFFFLYCAYCYIVLYLRTLVERRKKIKYLLKMNVSGIDGR